MEPTKLVLGMVLAGTVCVSAQSNLVPFGNGCGGVGGSATLSGGPALVLGGSSWVRVDNMPSNTFGVMLVGWANDRWSSISLPMSLASLGMPGCSLLVRPDVSWAFSVSGSSRQWPFGVPNTSSLQGQTMYGQGMFAQSGLNAVGIGNTNGLSGLIGSTGGNRVSQVSQWGITWTLSQPAQAGQFANGDWWVIGPVNVVQITPASTVVNGRTINGSMVNPVPNGTHGYDSTLYGAYAQAQFVYNPALNVATGLSASHPLPLPSGSSLVSSISQMTPDPVSFSQLSTAAVLTVLATPPAADAFRPPYAGTNKTIRFRESQLDYARLGTLAPIAGTPTPASLAPQFARVWLDHCPSWISRFMHPVLNMPDYGRDFTAAMGSGVLVANMNFSNQQKRDMVVGLVQIGIDTYGNLQNGCDWGSVSSQCAGRKFPLLFAGTLLSATDMQNIGQTYPSGYFGPGSPNNASMFGEDSSTFYVQQTSAGVYNWGYGGYGSSYLNLPEWGNYHSTVIANDNASWSADPYRRCCTANAWIAECLAARIMGLRPAWNHPAFFDYMDRYMQTEPAGWEQAWVPWHATAWNTYRPQL